MKTKLLLLSLCWLLGGHALRAQTTITSFTPASGLPGTEVTITGTGFDEIRVPDKINGGFKIVTAAVYFNGKQALVIANSKTSIKAKVPLGATSGRIEVRVWAFTATSATDFIVPGTPLPPTITSFAPAKWHGGHFGNYNRHQF
ncbi:MAG: IPT/TIG domain-containing protein [Cytophagales bacterium]